MIDGCSFISYRTTTGRRRPVYFVGILTNLNKPPDIALESFKMRFTKLVSYKQSIAYLYIKKSGELHSNRLTG